MHIKSVFTYFLLSTGFFILLGFSSTFSALAQATNQAIYLPPGQSSQGMIPPPGSGPTPAIVTPGDAESLPVPTDRISTMPLYGTNLQHQAALRRPRVNLIMNNQVVLTFQPDELTNTQRAKIQGIIPWTGNTPYENISVSEGQLQQMQAVLAPYPQTGKSAASMPNGQTRNQIFQDIPSQNALPHTNGPIVPMFPVIRNFCRYLVILGVVVGCIFMAFAAIGMQFGDRSAGARVVGSAAGIMLLLMGYSIWKVVRFNEDNARGPENTAGPLPVTITNPPPMQNSILSPGDVNQSKTDNSINYKQYANLPKTPNQPASVPRSGLPLAPLGDIH